jgi:predicted methyltransferase
VRVEFHEVARGLPRQFAIVTSFDVIHEAADLAASMARIHESLELGGVYMMVEPATGESLEDHLGPIGTILYSFNFSVHAGQLGR